MQSIELQFSGVESHISIGPGERYHAPLRRVFSIIKSNHPDVHPDLALRYALKDINDTIVPEGLVPSILVFGALPSYPISNNSFPGQTAKMRGIVNARTEYGKIVKEPRIERAIKSKLPPATKFIYVQVIKY